MQAAAVLQVIERRASNASAGPRSRGEGRRASRDRAKKEASPKQAEVQPMLLCCCKTLKSLKTAADQQDPPDLSSLVAMLFIQQTATASQAPEIVPHGGLSQAG